MKKAIGVFLMLVLVLGLCSCMPRVTESGFMQLGNWEWTAARDFSDGMAAVKKDGKWGFINTNGELVVDYSFADAKKVLSVNLFGTFLLMRAVLPVMQAQKHGAVLNFGSVSGLVGYPFESAYGASKAAIIHLTKNAASENGGNGVRINAISPGWVKTNMMATILDSYKNVGFDHAEENVTLGTMGRPGTPEEMANVAAFICSEEASYMNGSNILVDGGMTLG